MYPRGCRLEHAQAPRPVGPFKSADGQFFAEAAAERVKWLRRRSQRVDLICSYLLERIAQTLRVPPADLDEFAQLSALGVDSLTAVELRIWVQGDLRRGTCRRAIIHHTQHT